MIHTENAKRVSAHRERIKLKGVRRIEITAYEKDVALVRALTKILRDNSEQADKIREALGEFLPKNYGNIVEFFQNSPLAEEQNISFERDKDTGRAPEL